MGYLVKVTTSSGLSGMLRRGKICKEGTYYHHPSGASKSALSWLAKHPGGKFEVYKYTSMVLVDTYQMAENSCLLPCPHEL